MPLRIRPARYLKQDDPFFANQRAAAGSGIFHNLSFAPLLFQKTNQVPYTEEVFSPVRPGYCLSMDVRNHQACLAKDITPPHGARVIPALCDSGIINILLNISPYYLCYPGARIDGVINSMRSCPCSNKGGARHVVHPWLGLRRIGRCGVCGESRSHRPPAGPNAWYRQAVAIIRNPCRSDWTLGKPMIRSR